MAEDNQRSTGMFNFQQIMKDFYNYKPDADDDEGRMQKNAFQGNFIQSALDSSLLSSWVSSTLGWLNQT